MHRDHLGTILAITNNVGSLIEKRHFDPWGNIIRYYNEITGAKEPPTNNESALFLDRGYTGHEHLLSVGLINMNARLYDPVVHRFLQPDAFVQDPTNTQCYNRYGYAANNPLKYNDPSGNILPALLIAAFWGAGIGAATYTLTALLADVPFSVSGLIQAVAISTFSGVVTSGIGTAYSTITNLATKITVQALAHGYFQGSMSGIQGGSFISGFAAGCLASLASSAFGADYNGKDKAGLGFGGNFRGSGAGMIAFGTIMGGAGAALTGGNFWQGAVTGLVVSGLNHVAHNAMDRRDPPNKYKKWFSARMKEASALMDDIGDWGSNVGTAAGMTSDWATGSGAGSTIFVGGRVANAMSNANRVNQARFFYYNKYKGVSNLKGSSVQNFDSYFGLRGLLNAGFDPIEQFVGSYRVDVYNLSGKSLWFVLTNTTSMKSFLYGIGPEYNRSTLGPGANTNQTYI